MTGGAETGTQQESMGSSGSGVLGPGRPGWLPTQVSGKEVTSPPPPPLILLCQLGRYPLWHAHEFTQQQLLGRFEPEPVADLAMYLRQ